MKKEISNCIFYLQFDRTYYITFNIFYTMSSATINRNIFNFFYFFLFFFLILNIYRCKHRIYNHQSYIYSICLGIKNNNNKIKIKKKNETINLTKISYKTSMFNLQKVNIKSLRDKIEIYGGI